MSRKSFLRNSAFAMAGLAVLGADAASAANGVSDVNMAEGAKLILKNVRLETGFEYNQSGSVTSTKTNLFTIEIEKGKITKISANQPQLKNAVDAKGYLMLPSFKDMHIHLDKTFYGDKWQAVRRGGGGVKGMIALEQQMLPEMLKNSTYKAEKLIELLQSKGTTFARSHVNIEPTSKLSSLKNLQIALDNKKKSFGAELVAFPQHGVFYTNSAAYMKEAAQSDIDFIGGLDPFTVDGAIEKTMDFTVQLALDHQKGIDIHLHESGESGWKTIEYLIDKVNENPVLKGKTYISHAFALSRAEKGRLTEMIKRLAEAKIGIVSTIPLGNLMPIPALLAMNVEVLTGNDSIVDHWNTFGTGSVLQKASLAAQVYGQVGEFELSRMLGLATANVLPLNSKGEQQWPKVGDQANLAFLDASCSAEAVARISDVKSLIYEGNMLF
ncbi:amidohydrolase [Pedobacter ureilyticus]|uniref:Amidohydrolase n=1 Tax=Pedobacter ureilyticus TaxID=1393051 RepID=A0ABW9J2J5_9SPHI|nr:amidohydrolase [Pedobacter helvus]